MVDIVHHSVIGLGGAIAAQQLGQSDLAAGFLIGSVLPDLDAAFMIFGKATYLRNHQAATHSVFMLPLMSAAIALALSAIFQADWLLTGAGCFLGGLIHILFDSLNSFGVRAIWPLRRRFALDAFFFIDIYAFSASAAVTGLLFLGMNGYLAISAWAALIILYSATKLIWRRRIVKEAQSLTAVPSGIWPLTYFLTRRVPEGGIQSGNCSGTHRSIEWGDTTPNVDDHLFDVLRRGPIYRNLEFALKLFVPVSVVRNEAETVVVSRCVAVRNFSNHYGQTTSVIRNGEVIRETSLL